jgi:hypothetical protein
MTSKTSGALKPYNALTYLAVIALQSIMTLNMPWLPAEAVTIKDQPVQRARAVSVNEVFVTFLNDKNKIMIASSHDVLVRQPCYVDTSWLGMTLGEFVVSHIKPTQKFKCPAESQ